MSVRALCLVALGLLIACGPLDTESSVRSVANRWVFVSRVERVLSDTDCTAASVSLRSAAIRTTGGPKRVSSVRESLRYLEADRTVLFDVPGLNPNQVSEQLMSMRLFTGLGLLSSFIGPGRRCMDDQMAAEAYGALMSYDTLMIYDPTIYTILMVVPDTQRAFFLRTRSH